MSAKNSIKAGLKMMLRPGSRRYRFVRRVAEATHLIGPVVRDKNYMEWVERTEVYSWSKRTKLKYQPKISIVVPVFNPPAKYFLPMIYSVVGQTYDEWELILVNASTKSESRDRTNEAQQIDRRIKIINLSSNKGIAGNTNEGIQHASGEYIGLLDHDDLLAPEALYEMVLGIQERPKTGLVYSDEDKITANGEERFDPHLKPDWSPHLLRELNYLNHFTLIKKDLINAIGGYRRGFDGAQDYDLYLRLADQKPEVVHIPKVLYHWRTAETSTANNFAAKKGVLNAGVKAIHEHLERNNQLGSVEAIDKQPGFYEVQYTLAPMQSATIVILPSPIKSQYKLLVETVITKAKNSKINVEIIANELIEPISVLKPKNVIIKYLDSTEEEAYLQHAVTKSEADITIVINAAVIPRTKRWLEGLIGLLTQATDIGAVTPIILETDNKTIVDAGYVKQNDQLKPLFKGQQLGSHTYLGNTDWVRNIDATSGRYLVTRKSTLNDYLSSIKGQKFTFIGYSKYLREKNLSTVLWPFVELTYVGELFPSTIQTEYSNPSLVMTKEGFGVPKTINMPSIRTDDE